MRAKRVGAMGAALVLVLASQGAPGFAQSTFSGDATVVEVQVPVNVVRNGEPVRGLTKDDFEIIDKRKSVEITGFEVVDLSLVGQERDARSAEIPTMTIAGRRHLLLLFDLSNPVAMNRAREAARAIVADSLHPSDLVGVATFGKVQGTRIVLGFTGNREQAEAAIANLGLREWRNRVQDPLGLIVEGDLATAPREEEGGASEGRIDRQELNDQNARDLQIGFDRARLEQEKSSFLGVTTTFQKLADMIASANGRKHVVLLSEGFNSEILTGADDPARQLEINQSAELGETFRINSDERYGSMEASSSLQKMVESFKRADTTIQAVDIGGLETQSQKLSRNEAMFRMANGTGGELVENYNDLGSAMKEVLSRTSVTYLLSFTPNNLKMDGKFRPIKVRLKQKQRGVNLLHKDGYFPPTEFASLSPIERQLSTASELLGGAGGGTIPTSVLAAPFFAGEGSSYVPVLVEVDGPSLIASARGDAVMTEIFAYAFDETGAVRDFFTRRLGLDVAKSKDAMMQSGFKYWGHFDLDPGSYLVRVMARNGQTGEGGVAAVPVFVPHAGEAALLPPLVPEPMGKWVMGREDETEQRADVPFPFIIGGNPFVPAVVPSLGTAAAQMSLVGYNLGQGEVDISMRFLDTSGEVVEQAKLTIIDRSAAGGGMERLTVELAPTGLAAGNYMLEASVKDLAAGSEQVSSVAVNIGS